MESWPEGTALDVPRQMDQAGVGGGEPGGGLILVRESSVHLHLHGPGESVVVLLRVGGTRPVLGVVAVVRGLRRRMWSGRWPGSGRLGEVASMEVPDEGVVQDVPPRDTGPFFRAVTLPVHQVLESPPTPARLQEATDSVRGTSIDEARRGWRWHGRNQGALSDRFNFGDVKRGMNPHGSREFEPHCHRVDDLLDLERADEARSQFLGFHPEGKIPGGEPNLPTRLLVRGLGAVAIGGRCVAISGPE